MADLWLLDGATGAGKSFALDYLRNHTSGGFSPVTKLTTRQRRPTDNDWEFRFVEDLQRGEGRLVWEAVGALYGVDIAALENADDGVTRVMVCTELSVQEQLVQAVGARVLYFFRPMDDELFETLLDERGASSEVRVTRRSEREAIPTDYRDRLSWQLTTVLNIGDERLLEAQLETLIQAR
ncbi:MAG: hypothetical protein AAGA37_01890 [Actinomycetota bacterium]